MTLETYGQTPAPEPDPVEPDEQPTCANCGGAIGDDDLTCPHCGISLVSG